MDFKKTAVERAFDLARSGGFAHAGDVKEAVSREGFSISQLEGPMLMRQLREAIKAAKAESKPVV